MLAIALIIGAFGQLLIWACVLFEWAPGQATLHPTRCIRCKYDLAGLGENPVCPECGTHNLPQPSGKILVFQRSRARLIPLIACTSFVCATIPSNLAHFVLVLEIRALGYSWTVANTCAARNARSENELWMVLTVYAVALAPLVTMFKPPKVALIATFAFLLSYFAMLMITRF